MKSETKTKDYKFKCDRCRMYCNCGILYRGVFYCSPCHTTLDMKGVFG